MTSNTGGSELRPSDNKLEPSVMPLAHRAARGAGTMASAQILRIGLQLIGIVVLARLLVPSDYGLVAMATALVGVAEVLRDFGLAPAAIQAKALSSLERSNLVWANSALGLFLAALVACAAVPISSLYGDPRLFDIVLALSPIFFVNGVSSQLRADLSRGMRFRALARIEVAGQAIALVSGVAAAIIGMGYWAIVCQQLVQAIATLGLLIFATKLQLRKYDRTVSLRPFFRYGSSLLGTQLLVYLTSNLDSVLIGARFGSAQLGLYNRAFQMLVLPLNQINSPATKVALPVLARLQDNDDQFLRFIIRGQLCLSWVVLPAFGYAAVNSELVVTLLLGDQWREASAIFAILAVGGMFQTLSYTTYWVFLAKGLTASNLRFALVTRSFMLAALCIGSIFNVHAVAGAYSVSLLLIWLIGLLWISRASGFRSKTSLSLGLATLLLVMIASSASYVAGVYSSDLNSPLRLLITFAAFLACFSFLCLVIPPWRRQALDILSIVRILMRRKSSDTKSRA